VTWSQPINPAPFNPVPIDSTPITPHLLPGEQLMWTGRPGGRLFDATDVFMIPFSLMWGGFALFWETSVIATGAPLPMVLFGIPFVLLGLYLIIGRFVQRAIANNRTWYALTDRRALLVYGSAGQQVRSVSLESVTDVSVNRRANGRGTVSFGIGNAQLSRLSSSMQLSATGWGSLQRGPIAFVDIPDVATVEALANSYSRDLR
jgi:hypothetical protein